MSTPPPTPIITAFPSASGKIVLRAYVIEAGATGVPTKVEFYKNNGAGGAIDFGSPIGGGSVATVKLGHNSVALLETGVLPETAHLFSTIAFTSDDQPSLRAAQVTQTPDATLPPDPLSPAATTVRV